MGFLSFYLCLLLNRLDSWPHEAAVCGFFLGQCSLRLSWLICFLSFVSRIYEHYLVHEWNESFRQGHTHSLPQRRNSRQPHGFYSWPTWYAHRGRRLLAPISELKSQIQSGDAALCSKVLTHSSKSPGMPPRKLAIIPESLYFL